MWRRIATALLALFAGACAALPPPAEEAATSPRREVPSEICRKFRPPNGCFDLRDAEARRLFRELRGKQRIWECSSGLVQPYVTVAYTPRVIGPNRAETAELSCTVKNGRVLCGLERGAAYFADDPSAYFAVGGGISVADAVEIARAHGAGRVSRPIDVEERARLVAIVSAEDGSVVLVFDDCGCSWRQRVLRGTLRGAGDEATWLDVRGEIDGICE